MDKPDELPPDPPWDGVATTFMRFVARIERELGREMTKQERLRAKNAYSRNEPPSSLAVLIRRNER